MEMKHIMQNCTETASDREDANMQSNHSKFIKIKAP